ncbi:MAG: YbjN domain-containing protein [Actinomycetota bacterium]
MMHPREVFTAGELGAVLARAGFEVCEVDDGENPPSVFLAPTSDEVDWIVGLGPMQPFYEFMVLAMVGRAGGTDPLDVCNEWNLSHRFSQASHDPTDEEHDEDEPWEPAVESPVRLILHVSFAGGVTEDHLVHLVQQWNDDCCEFAERIAELRTWPTDDATETTVELPVLAPESTLADMVAAFLSVAPGKSARETAAFLDVLKHEVNHVLYKHADRFEMIPGQPPRWRNR